MNYFSTRDKSLKFSFKDIFLRGLAPGGGLFIPNEIKKYNHKFLAPLVMGMVLPLPTHSKRDGPAGEQPAPGISWPFLSV